MGVSGPACLIHRAGNSVLLLTSAGPGFSFSAPPAFPQRTGLPSPLQRVCSPPPPPQPRGPGWAPTPLRGLSSHTRGTPRSPQTHPRLGAGVCGICVRVPLSTPLRLPAPLRSPPSAPLPPTHTSTGQSEPPSGGKTPPPPSPRHSRPSLPLPQRGEEPTARPRPSVPPVPGAPAAAGPAGAPAARTEGAMHLTGRKAGTARAPPSRAVPSPPSPPHARARAHTLPARPRHRSGARGAAVSEGREGRGGAGRRSRAASEREPTASPQQRAWQVRAESPPPAPLSPLPSSVSQSVSQSVRLSVRVVLPLPPFPPSLSPTGLGG